STLFPYTTLFRSYNDEENLVDVSLNAGLKLPTGVTDIKNNLGELAEVTIQPGSGSTDYIFGATISANLLSLPTLQGDLYSAFPVNLNLSYKINNKGTLDYQYGNELQAHLSTAYRFVEKISLLLQINSR